MPHAERSSYDSLSGVANTRRGMLRQCSEHRRVVQSRVRRVSEGRGDQGVQRWVGWQAGESGRGLVAGYVGAIHISVALISVVAKGVTDGNAAAMGDGGAADVVTTSVRVVLP